MELNEDSPFNLYVEPKLQNSVMVIGWIEDNDHLGEKVTNYLIKKLECTEFGEVKSSEFFPSQGALGEENHTRFMESKFYFSQQKDIVVFKSSPPRFEWYKFLDGLLDVAESCRVKELYTISSVDTSCSHVTPRKLLVTVNSPELKNLLSNIDLTTEITCKTSAGQKPTINSFLLWLAGRRNIAGASLQVMTPYYLASTSDPHSCKQSVELLNMKLNLGVDFNDLDEEIFGLNETIANLRIQFPEIDSSIWKLETAPHRFQLGDISPAYQVAGYQCYLEGICLAQLVPGKYNTLDRRDSFPSRDIDAVCRAPGKLHRYGCLYG